LIPPLVNYGYAGQTLLLTELSLPANFTADTLIIKADVDWLVCEEICIPADASFELTLAVAGQSELADNQQPVAFFVAGNELVDHSASQQIESQNGSLLLQQALNTYFTAGPAEVEIVIIDAADQGYS
jgi:thiol:disulfide interchange protein DsbD